MGLDDIEPFKDLPQALVEEMLNNYKKLSSQLADSFNDVKSSKDSIRNMLKDSFLKQDSDIINIHVYPTTSGIDGAYAIDRLLSTDIVTVAAVAVEGLTPPTENRLWPEPHHLCEVLATRHHDSTSLIIGATMHAMELQLAYDAPHDVVFLDGSITTPIIRFNQAFNILEDVPQNLSKIFLDRIEPALKSYKEIVTATRSDKIYACVPKYTTTNEISSLLGLNEQEDRSLLSFILDRGELIGPLPISLPKGWHINKPNWPKELGSTAEELIDLMRLLNVIYYKPYEYHPAIRIEIPQSIARNNARLSIILEAIQLQCGAPGILEPYPLYLADRMVKHLSKALPAIRKATTQELSENTQEIGDIFLAMHGYRTESGR